MTPPKSSWEYSDPPKQTPMQTSSFLGGKGRPPPILTRRPEQRMDSLQSVQDPPDAPGSGGTPVPHHLPRGCHDPQRSPHGRVPPYSTHPNPVPTGQNKDARFGHI